MLASFQSKPAETENNIAKEKLYVIIVVWRPGIGVGVTQSVPRDGVAIFFHFISFHSISFHSISFHFF